MIICKQLDHFDSYKSLTNWRNIILNDMSMSAWQYVLMYGTANGSLHLSEQVINPGYKPKKSLNLVSFTHLMHYLICYLIISLHYRQSLRLI